MYASSSCGPRVSSSELPEVPLWIGAKLTGWSDLRDALALPDDVSLEATICRLVPHHFSGMCRGIWDSVWFLASSNG
jgi:hypothetical protein